MIVIEGPDNSGKSTLAAQLSLSIGIPVMASEGPEKFPGEINQRVRRYFSEFGDGVLFDRHPCVSQEIYRRFSNKTPIESHLIERFYGARPVFIYCRLPEGRGLVEQILKPHDTPDHQTIVSDNIAAICAAYDTWAVQHAGAIYRIGDNIRPIMQYAKEAYHNARQTA